MAFRAAAPELPTSRTRSAHRTTHRTFTEPRREVAQNGTSGALRDQSRVEALGAREPAPVGN